MDEFRLMTREEIIRRLVRLKGVKHLRRTTEVTYRDVARWVGVSRRCCRAHMEGAFAMTDAHQLAYSAFFSLFDGGCLKIEISGRGRQKTVVRVEPPKEAPKREARPFVDFPTMRLKME